MVLRWLAVVALTSNASAESLELRVSAGVQLLTDTAYEPDEAASDGAGGRFDLAIGVAGLHARIGASTLGARVHFEDVFLGNTINEWTTDTVSAHYLRAGFDVERWLGTSVVMTAGGGLVWARHRKEHARDWYYEPRPWDSRPLVTYMSEDTDDDLRYGVWLETKFAWVYSLANDHALGIELGVGYERLARDDATEITRTALVSTIGIAYRWN